LINASSSRRVERHGDRQRPTKLGDQAVGSRSSGSTSPNGFFFTSRLSPRHPPSSAAAAFDGSEKIIESRTARRQIVYQGRSRRGLSREGEENPFGDVEPDDLLRYGLIPELVGRLPVTVPLDALDEDALIKILTEPKNALAKQYQKLFDLEDVALTLEKDALKAIAAKGDEARHRRERTARHPRRNDDRHHVRAASRDDVREVAITAECVTSGRAPLLVTERPPQKKEA